MRSRNHRRTVEQCRGASSTWRFVDSVNHVELAGAEATPNGLAMTVLVPFDRNLAHGFQIM
jgi:hypothetical protein